MKIYLATGNKNKKREMSEILSEHTIITPSDEGIDFNPIENGTSFFENSLIKAKALFEIVKCPVIADDSGICVDALNGRPGIFSARYAGPDFPEGMPDSSKIPQEKQNEFLINQLNDELKNTKKDFSIFLNGPRSAHYTCSMVLYLGKDRFFISQNTMEGAIIESIEDSRGTGGFGYDPIFFLPNLGKTAAELTADEKNAISHRGKSTRVLVTIINNLKKIENS